MSLIERLKKLESEHKELLRRQRKEVEANLTTQIKSVEEAIERTRREIEAEQDLSIKVQEQKHAERATDLLIELQSLRERERSIAEELILLEEACVRAVPMRKKRIQGSGRPIKCGVEKVDAYGKPFVEVSMVPLDIALKAAVTILPGQDLTLEPLDSSNSTLERAWRLPPIFEELNNLDLGVVVNGSTSNRLTYSYLQSQISPEKRAAFLKSIQE